VAGLLADPANRGVRFDGGNDRVEVLDSASLDLTTRFSLEAWIRPAALPASGSFASVMTKAESYSLQFNGSRLEFTVIRNGTRQRTQAAAGAIAVNRTYHVVGTFDGATARLYIDGVLAASRAATSAATVTTSPLVIASWDSWSEMFKGIVDEPAVYGTALPAARVKAHYDAGAPPSATAASAPRANTKRISARSSAAGFCPLNIPGHGRRPS
jgi:hypothetical protein